MLFSIGLYYISTLLLHVFEYFCKHIFRFSLLKKVLIGGKFSDFTFAVSSCGISALLTSVSFLVFTYACGPKNCFRFFKAIFRHRNLARRTNTSLRRVEG